MNKQILELINKRLLIGEKKYGNENVATDIFSCPFSRA